MVMVGTGSGGVDGTCPRTAGFAGTSRRGNLDGSAGRDGGAAPISAV